MPSYLDAGLDLLRRTAGGAEVGALPVVVDTVEATVTDGAAAVTFYTVPDADAADESTYLVLASLRVNVAPTAGTLGVSITATDDGDAITTVLIAATVAGTVNTVSSGFMLVRADKNTNIQYTITEDTYTAGPADYDLTIHLIRLS